MYKRQPNNTATGQAKVRQIDLNKITPNRVYESRIDHNYVSREANDVFVYTIYYVLDLDMSQQYEIRNTNTQSEKDIIRLIGKVTKYIVHTKLNMSKKPLILVTNDDGISAPGIRTLISVMNEIGDVVVVAPNSPQSAMGHAITINSTIHCNSIKIDNGPQQEYSCSGTPADCVKLGINEILDRKPDLCVSGVNHGSNSSINVIYSGTMSAAVEASIEGIPAIGFSLLDYSWEADFETIKEYIISITKKALNNGIPMGNALNINFPKLKGCLLYTSDAADE